MPRAEAIRVALDLFRVPARAAVLRGQLLPQGISELLSIASGDQSAAAEAAKNAGSRPEEIIDAAKFYCQQILWHPTADPFRVLGTNPDASRAEIKRNMSLMMAWLHPDADRNDMHAVYTTRVVGAWNQVKTNERLDQYLTKAAAPAQGTRMPVRPQLAHDEDGRSKRLHRQNRFTRKRTNLPIWRQILHLILGPMRR